MLHTSNFKIIKIKNPYKTHLELYKTDCNRIQSALLDYGYYASLEQCVELWEQYSSEYAAGWLHLPDRSEEIYSCIKNYFEEV